MSFKNIHKLTAFLSIKQNLWTDFINTNMIDINTFVSDSTDLRVYRLLWYCMRLITWLLSKPGLLCHKSTSRYFDYQPDTRSI